MNVVPRILALNPNSSESVTQSVVHAMRCAMPERMAEIVGVTCSDGPEGIVTQADFEDARHRVGARVVGNFLGAYDAAVIACFSDPGLEAVRSQCAIPVIGMGEAGMRCALQAGERVGVVAVADAAIPRHLAYWERIGIGHRVVGERALNISVAASGDHVQAFERMLAAGRTLRDKLHADAILLGCAGMSALRGQLESALDVPVIDPCAAAIVAAIDAVNGKAKP
ncbi:Asp/Glu racemase [Corticibacter populi]|uniref:Asp/Glu racemase n=1 Tax=Corticibacter populi TaxID=1550736 RepID=A0A3M6QS28_9BURK|nr:aspartate/glutamate racemase family protein [Corticibacter populi]RMX05827.1 Asp/Glu racemase [Corticibacter populi]RZS30859.1 Asp/Glu/hydantoin racemase [Corticibacter populi]